MKILIADHFDDQGMEKLKQAGLEVIFEPQIGAENLPAKLEETQAEFLIVRSTKLDEKALKASNHLQMIVRAGAGYDNIDTEVAGKNGIYVCNCPGTNSAAVAELTIGLIISIDRRIPDQVADVKRGIWNKQDYAKSRGLKGLTLGIVGMGQIGQHVAKRALAFELNVIYYDLSPKEFPEDDFKIDHVTLDELYQNADIISLHAPNTPSTKDMINAEAIAKMKKGVWIINTSRGDIIAEEDLYNALESGDVGFAAFDVYALEPAAANTKINTKFSKLDNFYGTHHVGASTSQAQAAVAEMAVENILNFVKNKSVYNCVNKEHYRPKV